MNFLISFKKLIFIFSALSLISSCDKPFNSSNSDDSDIWKIDVPNTKPMSESDLNQVDDIADNLVSLLSILDNNSSDILKEFSKGSNANKIRSEFLINCESFVKSKRDSQSLLNISIVKFWSESKLDKSCPFTLIGSEKTTESRLNAADESLAVKTLDWSVSYLNPSNNDKIKNLVLDIPQGKFNLTSKTFRKSLNSNIELDHGKMWNRTDLSGTYVLKDDYSAPYTFKFVKVNEETTFKKDDRLTQSPSNLRKVVMIDSPYGWVVKDYTQNKDKNGKITFEEKLNGRTINSKL